MTRNPIRWLIISFCLTLLCGYLLPQTASSWSSGPGPEYSSNDLPYHKINFPESNRFKLQEMPYNPDSLQVSQCLTDQDLSVGLVLSGGGAKGIAHVGVLRVLEEAGVRVDYISGTSMGSIVAALYSIGYTPDELSDLAIRSDWEELLTDRISRRLLSMYEKERDEQYILTFPITERGIDLPTGLVAGQNIYAWLTRHTWNVLDIDDFSELPIPFATVATDLETGEAVVFKGGYLPDAIRSSISFPSALIPHKVDDRYLLDGGLVRNLPVEEVLEMGADCVIAVDVSSRLRPIEELSSLAMILNQVVYFRIIERMDEQKELADLVIQISELDSYTVADFDESERFLQLGEDEARLYLDELKEIAARQSHSPTHRNPLPHRDRIYVDRISVSGNSNVPSTVIQLEAEHLEGRYVQREEIESVIRQLYGTRLFNLVNFRIHPIGDDRYELEFRVLERTEDTFRVGARYESNTQASLQLHTSFRNLIHRGSDLQFNFRMGRDSHFSIDYMLIRGPGARFGLNLQLKYDREEINFYANSERVSSLTHHNLRGELIAGTFLNRSYMAGIGLRGDVYTLSQQINPNAIPVSEKNSLTLFGQYKLDTLNRRSFPVDGHQLFIRASLSDQLFGSDANFNEQRFYWKAWHQLFDFLSLQHTLYLGRTDGDHLPWSYWFAPNRIERPIGMTRFGGYDRYEVSGRNIQLLSAGVQVEFLRHRFIRLDLYAGNVFDEWSWNVPDNSYRTGLTLTIGALSILGPLELMLSHSAENRLIYELQIGYEF